MKASIIPNYEKKDALSISENLKAALSDMGFEYSVAAEGEAVPDCDFIITIGGDGTIIHAAKEGAKRGIPILGVNAGRLGYLADLPPNDFSPLRRLLTGDYRIEERMMLEVGYEGEKYCCLNDAVISKGALSRMIDIDLSADDSHIRYRADGVIAATPTGSTAYSMSAGGPVVDPSLGLIVVTPICSNSLFDRTVLFGDGTVITVRPLCRDGAQAYLTIDGERSVPIENGGEVTVRRAERAAKLIKLRGNSFYKTLSEKMRG